MVIPWLLVLQLMLLVILCQVVLLLDVQAVHRHILETVVEPVEALIQQVVVQEVTRALVVSVVLLQQQVPVAGAVVESTILAVAGVVV